MPAEGAAPASPRYSPRPAVVAFEHIALYPSGNGCNRRDRADGRSGTPAPARFGAPAVGSGTTMSLVLVAIDETDASRRVAQFVNDFFDRSEVEVIGLNVGRGPAAWVPPMVGWGGAWSWSAFPYAYTVEEQTRAHEQQAVATEEAAARALDESDLQSAETVVEHGGDPADVIIAVADERGADLIVIGTSHKGLLQRVIDPSVSDQVLKQSDRPVIVVP